MASIEAAGNLWTNTYSRRANLTPERIDAARSRVFDRMAPPAWNAFQHPRRLPVLRLTVAAAALSCAVLGGIGVWRSRENFALPTPPPPHRLAPAESASPLPQPPQAVATAAPVLSPPEVIPPPPPPDKLDPEETAVDLLWILHQHGLCRSGSIDVAIASGAVDVRGAVETATELADLRSMLTEARGDFRFSVRAAADVASPAALTTQGRPETSSSHSPPGDAIIGSYLNRQNVPTERRTSEALRISNQAVRLANDAWIESWAVRRLLDRFRADSRLSELSETRLARMALSHLDAMNQALDEEYTTLAPVLGVETTPSSPGATAELTDVARLSDLIQDTFAGVGPDQPSPDERIARLRDLMTAVRAQSTLWTASSSQDWHSLVAVLRVNP